MRFLMLAGVYWIYLLRKYFSKKIIALKLRIADHEGIKKLSTSKRYLEIESPSLFACILQGNDLLDTY